MRRRLWFIWGIIPAVFSIVKFALSFAFLGKAKEKLDLTIFENYKLAMTFAGFAVFFFCLIGLLVTVSKIFKDARGHGVSRIIKYFFPSMIFYSLLKSVFDIATMGEWETETASLIYDINVALGQTPPVGHASGLSILGSFAIAFVQFLFFTIWSIVSQVRYSRMKPCKMEGE